jgi:hypothetical protein
MSASAPAKGVSANTTQGIGSHAVRYARTPRWKGGRGVRSARTEQQAVRGEEESWLTPPRLSRVGWRGTTHAWNYQQEPALTRGPRRALWRTWRLPPHCLLGRLVTGARPLALSGQLERSRRTTDAALRVTARTCLENAMGELDVEAGTTGCSGEGLQPNQPTVSPIRVD